MILGVNLPAVVDVDSKPTGVDMDGPQADPPQADAVFDDAIFDTALGDGLIQQGVVELNDPIDDKGCISQGGDGGMQHS
jgi:hypothetical protein